MQFEKIIKLNDTWRKDYKKQDSKFLSRENIFKNVVKILKFFRMIFIIFTRNMFIMM